MLQAAHLHTTALLNKTRALRTGVGWREGLGCGARAPKAWPSEPAGWWAVKGPRTPEFRGMWFVSSEELRACRGRPLAACRGEHEPGGNSLIALVKVGLVRPGAGVAGKLAARWFVKMGWPQMTPERL